jgi:hypothetical protein
LDALEQFLAFTERLTAANIQYNLDRQRDAIMVTIVTPRAYYEVEFFADGHIDVQTFAAGPVDRMTLDEITDKILGEMGD